MRAALGPDRGRIDALGLRLLSVASAARSAERSPRRPARSRQRMLELAFAQRPDLGKPHAIGRKDAGVGVHKDRLHAQRIGNQAGMLAAGTAKALKGIAGHVVAALDGDLLDRVRHVLDRDAQEILRPSPRALRGASPVAAAISRGQLLRTSSRTMSGSSGWSAFGAKDRREMVRLQFAQHDVAIGHRQRPAAPVAGRARIGTRALGAHLEPPVAEGQDRAAARCDRVDRHHRCPHAHARDFCLERPLVGPGKMADIRADVPPISKPISRSWPASSPVLTMPTTPACRAR